jgi:hypothetical protein
MTTISAVGSCRRHETSARRSSALRSLVVITIEALNWIIEAAKGDCSIRQDYGADLAMNQELSIFLIRGVFSSVPFDNR